MTADGPVKSSDPDAELPYSKFLYISNDYCQQGSQTEQGGQSLSDQG